MSLCLFSVTASLSPSLSMSMYAPIYVCVCLSVQSLFTSLTLFATCLSLSFSLSLSSNLSISLNLSVCPICLYLSVSFSQPLSLSLFASTYLSLAFSSSSLRLPSTLFHSHIMQDTYHRVHGQGPPLVLGLALNLFHLCNRVFETDVVKYLSRLIIEKPDTLPMEFD